MPEQLLAKHHLEILNTMSIHPSLELTAHRENPRNIHRCLCTTPVFQTPYMHQTISTAHSLTHSFRYAVRNLTLPHPRQALHLTPCPHIHDIGTTSILPAARSSSRTTTTNPIIFPNPTRRTRSPQRELHLLLPTTRLAIAEPFIDLKIVSRSRGIERRG